MSRGKAHVKKDFAGKEPKTISQRVGWLNQHGWLAQRISWNDIGESLLALDEDIANSLLDQLAEGARKIQDPTNWLKAAISRGGLGKDGQREVVEDGRLHGMKKIQKTVGWLNTHANFAEPIKFNDVVGALLNIGDKAAGQLLKELANANEQTPIQKPTNWLLSAVARAGPGKGNGKSGVLVKNFSISEKSRSPKSSSPDKIPKTIEWLNENMSFEKPIRYNTVEGPLNVLGVEQAGKLLHEFGSVASTVKDPTKWILSKARTWKV